MPETDTKKTAYNTEIKRYFDTMPPHIERGRLQAEADAAWMSLQQVKAEVPQRGFAWRVWASLGALALLLALATLFIDTDPPDINEEINIESSAAERFWASLDTTESDDIATMLTAWEKIVEHPVPSKEEWIQSVASDWQILDTGTLFNAETDTL